MAKTSKNEPIARIKQVNVEKITSNISKNDLKTFFYLFTRKPNTISKNFYGKNIIKKEDIIELFSKICEKLRLHKIDGLTTSTIIALESNKYLEFGDFDSFSSYHFDEKEVVESIVIKFNFLLIVDEHIAPEHYSLNIRLSGEFSPMVYFRMLLNQNSTEIDDIDFMMPYCNVNINFIDNIVSEELLNIIGNWYESRRKVIIEGKFLEWVKSKNDILSSMAYYFSLFIGVIIIMLILLSKKLLFHQLFYESKGLVFHILLVFGILWVSRKLGIIVERSFDKLLRKIGQIPVFQITKGDFSNLDKIAQRNSDSRAKLIRNAVFEFIIGFLASLTVWLLTKS
jgi:hypothetical protein